MMQHRRIGNKKGYLLRRQPGEAVPEAGGALFENLIFIRSFAWFPQAFLLALVVLVVFSWWQLKKSSAAKVGGKL